MATGFLAPLNIPILLQRPLAPDANFIKVYNRLGYLKGLLSNNTEYDLVLDRPLDGYSNLPAVVLSSTDSVIQAFSKLQSSLNSLKLTGAVEGQAEYKTVPNRLEIETVLSYSGLRVKYDYDYDIIGLRNSSNKSYTLTNNYEPTSVRVFLNGLRLTPGSSYDYIEVLPNQILFTNAPDNGDLIIADYIIKQ